MISSEIAHRYAKVLFDLAPSDEVLMERSSILQKITDSFKTNPKVLSFFNSPQISKEMKSEVLKKSLKDLNDDFMTIFLTTLIKKGRFKYLPEITREYIRKAHIKLGLLEARLTTAAPLDCNIAQELKAALQKAYKKKINIQEFIEPQLLGGGILYIDNKQVDFSLNGKLLRLKNYLLAKKI